MLSLASKPLAHDEILPAPIITIKSPGRHNVLNSLAAIAVGIELDFVIKVIKNGFKNFIFSIEKWTTTI